MLNQKGDGIVDFPEIETKAKPTLKINTKLSSATIVVKMRYIHNNCWFLKEKNEDKVKEKKNIMMETTLILYPMTTLLIADIGINLPSD